jgi:hypothetical protein
MVFIVAINIESATYGIHGIQLSMNAMLIMHKQCVHHQANGMVINHRMVILLHTQLPIELQLRTQLHVPTVSDRTP